jgi:hypothetical protein
MARNLFDWQDRHRSNHNSRLKHEFGGPVGATVQLNTIGKARRYFADLNRSLASSHKTIIVWFAHLAGEVGVAFFGVVAGELFPGRVPLKFTTAVKGSDDEVADDGGTVAFFDASDRVFA